MRVLESGLEVHSDFLTFESILNTLLEGSIYESYIDKLVTQYCMDLDPTQPIRKSEAKHFISDPDFMKYWVNQPEDMELRLICRHLVLYLLPPFERKVIPIFRKRSEEPTTTSFFITTNFVKMNEEAIQICRGEWDSNRENFQFVTPEWKKSKRSHSGNGMSLAQNSKMELMKPDQWQIKTLSAIKRIDLDLHYEHKEEDTPSSKKQLIGIKINLREYSQKCHAYFDCDENQGIAHFDRNKSMQSMPTRVIKTGNGYSKDEKVTTHVFSETALQLLLHLESGFMEYRQRQLQQDVDMD